MPRRPAPLPVELALLGLLAVLWGSSYLLIKVALSDIPPLTLIAARVTIAAGFLLGVARLQGMSLPRDRRTWAMLLVQACLNSICAWTLLAWGQQHLDSGLAGVLNSTAPIFVLLIGWAVVRAGRPAGWEIAGAVLGLAGVILIVGVDALAGLGAHVAAELAVLASAALYGGAALYGRRFGHLPPTVTAAGTMVWAAIWLVPASLVVDSPWRLAPGAAALAATGALGLLCTGVAMLLYFRLIGTLGSMGVASQAYLRAGVSVLLGVLVLGERLTPAVAAGIALAILGVAAINTVPILRAARSAARGTGFEAAETARADR